MNKQIQQPQTLPSFWQEKFERSLKPPAKPKRKRKCGCKKIHLMGLVDWSDGSGSNKHGGHLTTTNARRVTCFICLGSMLWDHYLKYPDDFPKDFVVWNEKSMSLLVSAASGRDPSGEPFGGSASLVFPGGSKEGLNVSKKETA